MKLISSIQLRSNTGSEWSLEEEIEIADRQAGFAAISEYASAGFPPCNVDAIQSVTFVFEDGV